MELADETIRHSTKVDGDHRNVAGEGEADFLVGPLAFVKMLCHQRHERIHRRERVLDLILPGLRRVNVGMGHKCRDAVTFEPLLEGGSPLPHLRLVAEEDPIAALAPDSSDGRGRDGAP